MTPRLLLRAFATLLAAAALACGGDPEPGRYLPGEWPFEPFREGLGEFELSLEGTGWEDARLRAVHGARPDAPVLETLPGVAFVGIGRGRASLEGEGAGARVADEVQERCADVSIDAVELELYVLRLAGRFRCAVLDRAFELFVVPEGDAELRVHLRLEDPSFNRIELALARAPGERFFGLGAQPRLEHSGRRVPVWLTPPPPRGAGSDEPGGAPVAVAHLLTSRGRGLLLENREHAVFDLRADDRFGVAVHARELTFRVHAGASPGDLVARVTAATGRPPALPGWADGGALVELGGGSEAVRERVAALAAAGVVPAAVQIHDWFGPGSFDPDPERYPDAEALTAELAEQGIRSLVEVGPRFAARPADERTRALVETLEVEGWSVKGAEGAPLGAGEGASLGAGEGPWIDLANPDARGWWERLLRTRLGGRGLAGVVLTGGASLPFEARLAGDRDGAEYHNAYADALARAGSTAFRGDDASDGLVLVEAGSVWAPRHGVVFLAGEARDPASWTRLLGAGLSGYAYAAVDVVPEASPDALRRSLSLAAMAPLFRVRAGALDAPEAPEALARALRLRLAWAGYRRELVRRARDTGAPILRPLWFHASEWASGEVSRAGRSDAFWIGDQLLSVPVFEPGDGEVEIVLPPGRFVDVYTGEVHGEPGSESRVVLEAPAWRTPLLHLEGSIVGPRLLRKLELPGPS